MTALPHKVHGQLLSGPPARSVGAVVERLLAVQAQDLVGARLSVRARSTGLVASDVDRGLQDRELVVSWLNRGTLHLVRAEDFPWLHTLTTPQLGTSNATRLRQEGVTAEQADRGVRVVEGELLGGPRTRPQLRAALESADVPVAGQAVPHLLLLATLRGVCVRGPLVGREQAFVLVRDWLPDGGSVDREAALALLGRRYLAAHRPADERDLAKWAGVTLGDARAALRAQAGTPVPPAPAPPPRLLGPFDELLMGWASRADVLAGSERVVTLNGVFRPVLLVDGQVAGLWRRVGSRVELAPSRALAPDVVAALSAEAADVERFLAG